METVKARTDLLEDLPQQAATMKATFHPLLKAREADIKSVPLKTFKYGPTDRHQLDVLFPPSDSPSTAPVLFYVYGGGFAGGAKAFDPPYDLIHTNVGAFFAKQGFVVVIADYRLFPNIKFPDCSTDIRDALAFVVQHADEINNDAKVKGDFDCVFFLGHSVGAAIVSTLMLLPSLLPTDLRRRVSGVVLQGGAYHYRSGPLPLPAAQYYETEEARRRNEPLALLESAPEELIRGLPPILLMTSENEPGGVAAACADFRMTLVSRLRSDVPSLVMKGHNHTSIHFCLLSGEGEQWAYDVAGWLKGGRDSLL